MNFWFAVSRFILKGRIPILIVLGLITYFLGSQMQYMRFSHSEANLLPKNHPVNLEYNQFLDVFGDEGNLIILATQDSSVFQVDKFNNWNTLSKGLESHPEIVDFTISIADIKKLTKDNVNERFDVEPLYKEAPKNNEEVEKIRDELFNKLPFFENFLYNKETGTIRTVIYLKQDIVNTIKRKDFIFDVLNPSIEKFELDNELDVRVSGMPYIRTMNSQNIIDEIGIFVGLALGITSLIFFFFFRSFRATYITMLVVSIGVIWAFGFIGLFQYEISVLTALIPPLIIVIGVPNCVFLIHKYQHEVKSHGKSSKVFTTGNFQNWKCHLDDQCNHRFWFCHFCIY